MGFPPLQTGPSPAASPQPSQQVPAGFKPNYDILASLNSSRPSSQSSTPAPGVSPQPRFTATPPQAADPFAALVSASPRPASAAFQTSAPHGQGAPVPSSTLLDLAGGVSSSPQPQPTGQAPATEDDEWNFASSLPPSNVLPSTNKVQVLNSQLRIDFVARRVPSVPRQIHIQAVFSNTTAQPISELHFQVAVEKVNPISRRTTLNTCHTDWILVIYPTAPPTVRPRSRTAAAVWRQAGHGLGWHRQWKGQLGEDPIQGFLQAWCRGS